MSSNPEYQKVLKIVSEWPPEERIALASEVLATVAPPPSRPPRRTLDRALGLARTNGPVPSDADVRQMIDEHRREKYGA